MRSAVLLFVFCSAMASADTPPVADQRPSGMTGANWQFGPLNRWAYTHIREILPTKDIPNDPHRVLPIPGIDIARDDIIINIDGKAQPLSAAMRQQYVDGILAIRNGAAVVERYDGTLTPDRTHLMWSVSKTVTSLVAASVAADGLIELDRTVADYVPELVGSGWADDSLRALLDMRDSSDWNEDYDAADSTVRRQDCADGLLTGETCGDVDVVGNYRFLPAVGGDATRKGQFHYKSGTTDVMAWVLEAATGKRFADLVSARLWQPIGAEKNAGITVDVSGFTLASGGMFATLRDIARVGLLMADRGKAGGEQVVPADWLDDIFGQQGDPEWAGFRLPDAKPYYRAFVWGAGDGRGTVSAQGVHGQYIYVVPATNTVIAMFSSWPNADGGEAGVGHAQAFAILQAVEQAIR